MNSLNQIIIEGELVKDFELKECSAGVKMCTATIATKRSYRTSFGESVDEVSWIEIESYGNLAEACNKHGKKSRWIRVVGRLKQNKWIDSDEKSHSGVVIVAEHIEFMPKGFNRG